MQASWMNSSKTLREDSGNAFVHAEDKRPVMCSCSSLTNFTTTHSIEPRTNRVSLGHTKQDSVVRIRWRSQQSSQRLWITCSQGKIARHPRSRQRSRRSQHPRRHREESPLHRSERSQASDSSHRHRDRWPAARKLDGPLERRTHLADRREDVVFFRDQNLSPQRQLELGEYYGEVEIHPPSAACACPVAHDSHLAGSCEIGVRGQFPQTHRPSVATPSGHPATPPTRSSPHPSAASSTAATPSTTPRTPTSTATTLAQVPSISSAAILSCAPTL